MRMIDSVEARQLRAEENGKLTLGFSWFSPPPKAETDPMLWIGIALAVIAMVLMATNNTVLGILLILGATYPLHRSFKASSGRPPHNITGMTFSTDGGISATNPDRTTYSDGKIHIDWFTLKRTVDDLVSISMQPMKNNAGQHYKHERDKNDPAQGYFAYNVVVDFSTGERYYAGMYFSEDDARIVVVQLQQALQKVLDRRQELAAAGA